MTLVALGNNWSSFPRVNAANPSAGVAIWLNCWTAAGDAVVAPLAKRTELATVGTASARFPRLLANWLMIRSPMNCESDLGSVAGNQHITVEVLICEELRSLGADVSERAADVLPEGRLEAGE